VKEQGINGRKKNFALGGYRKVNEQGTGYFRRIVLFFSIDHDMLLS